MPPNSAPITRAGAWPFTTLRVARGADGVVKRWDSRRHRKGLSAAGAATSWHRLWTARDLNIWIGAGFSMGSMLFLWSAMLSLAPDLVWNAGVSTAAINRMYFVGSIFFTAAALLQLHQAGVSGRPFDGTSNARLFDWRPDDAGWLACALQFVGTLLFNLNTYDAMSPGLSWVRSDLMVWVPDLLGSVLFLASGYIAFVETCHAHWRWQPKNLSWWIVAINLLGCVAFMLSALSGYAPRPGAAFDPVDISVGFTALGALGFLIGAMLLFPEAAGADAAQE